MINITDSIYKLYPNVIRTVGDIAYDSNGDEVAYDLQAVTAQAEADAQAIISAKESAISKLTELGLNADEIKALLGVA
jgi:hypothetical protein